jgi:hypothetical protein
MVVRGTNFRDDYDFELYGEEVTAILQPLVDDEFLPLAAFLSEHFDLEEDVDQDEAVSEAIDKVEEAEESEDEPIDISKLDEEFVAIMQEAAVLGLYGGYDNDGEPVEYSEEESEEIVKSMMGGYSVELGGRVLELSGDVRDAEKFRGGRGSVDSTRDSR